MEFRCSRTVLFVEEQSGGAPYLQVMKPRQKSIGQRVETFVVCEGGLEVLRESD